eukprot:2889289-Amphidinium_carterae.1
MANRARVHGSDAFTLSTALGLGAPSYAMWTSHKCNLWARCIRLPTDTEQAIALPARATSTLYPK